MIDQTRTPKVIGIDTACTDILVAGNQVPFLPALAARYDLRTGGKRAINAQEFREFAGAVTGHVIGSHPGGSVANTLVTLKRLVGSSVRAGFLSAIDDSPAGGRKIRDAFFQAGVRLVEPDGLILPQAATSYVFVLQGGERSIVSYSGNAKEVLAGEALARRVAREADSILLPGSLWQKLGSEFPNKLVQQSQHQGKDLWLALPTNADFARKHRAFFQSLVSTATVTLGNTEELGNVFGLPRHEALQALHGSLRAASVSDTAAQQPLAFITAGADGAYVVDAREVAHIAPVKVANVVNTLGAGDTAFAGFLAGYVADVPPKMAAMMGVTLAAEKVRHNNGARLDEPQRDLKRLDPELAYQLRAARNRLGAARAASAYL